MSFKNGLAYFNFFHSKCSRSDVIKKELKLTVSKETEEETAIVAVDTKAAPPGNIFEKYFFHLKFQWNNTFLPLSLFIEVAIVGNLQLGSKCRSEINR